MGNKHECPGDDCGFCRARISDAEDARIGNHDIDGAMADYEADRMERRMEAMWENR